MSNPYQSPIGHNQPRDVRSITGSPAMALIVVSAIAVVCGVLSLIADAVMAAIGANDNATILMVRTIWGILLIVASSFVLYGAIQMRNQRNYGIAKMAAIVALIPLVGPCCILGIPFGIWALVALSKPGVEDAFQ